MYKPAKFVSNVSTGEAANHATDGKYRHNDGHDHVNVRRRYFVVAFEAVANEILKSGIFANTLKLSLV